MAQAISSLISTLAKAVSGVSPFAKAIVPSAAGLVGALVNMAFAGSFDTTSIVVLAVGVVAAVVTYLVPNRAKPAPVKPAAKAKKG
ncbi:MAG: hypothetical protein ACYCQK_02010 [Acidiferrobacteraceae bacterium]